MTFRSIDKADQELVEKFSDAVFDGDYAEAGNLAPGVLELLRQASLKDADALRCYLSGGADTFLEGLRAGCRVAAKAAEAAARGVAGV